MNIVFFPSYKYNWCLNTSFHLQKTQKSKFETLYEYGAWISCHSTLPSPIPPRAPLPGPESQTMELSLVMALINARLFTAFIQPQRLPLTSNRAWSFDLPQGPTPRWKTVLVWSKSPGPWELLLPPQPINHAAWLEFSVISPQALKMWERPLFKCLDMLIYSNRKRKDSPERLFGLGMWRLLLNPLSQQQ